MMLTVGFWVAGLPGALPGDWAVGRAGAGASMVAAAAAMRPAPDLASLALKDPRDWKIAGHRLARLDTVDTDLVVEKRMEGLSPDGAPHFEVFPFSGDTRPLSAHVRSHNYWAELKRPFYSSGRTGTVGQGDHVVKGVSMTFQRAAESTAPQRYDVGKGNLVETTRGIFYGQGHIEPSSIVRNRFDVLPGNFQLCGSTNPSTGGPANTYFYGVFYGKVSDWNNDGTIEFNSLPVHSTLDGRVDAHGDGRLAPTSVRPEDWG